MWHILDPYHQISIIETPEMWKILIVDIQVTNLQQLCDIIMSDLRNISSTILSLFYEELKQLCKTKGRPNRCKQGEPYKLADKCKSRIPSCNQNHVWNF